jgi:hypothetical protein
VNASPRSLDQRNALLLVDEEFRERLARLPKGISPAYSSVWTRVEIYRYYSRKASVYAQNQHPEPYTGYWAEHGEFLRDAADKVEAWLNRNLRLSVADGGEGRREVVEAVRAETGSLRTGHAMLSDRMGAPAPAAVVQVTNGSHSNGKRSFLGRLAEAKLK